MRFINRSVKGAIGLTLLSMLLAACTAYDGFARPSDIRKEETIVLTDTQRGDPVYAMDIHIQGHIRGEAAISLMLNGKPYRTEKLSGLVSVNWGGDWYSDTADIQYRPTTVSSGELLIQYKFHRLHPPSRNGGKT